MKKSYLLILGAALLATGVGCATQKGNIDYTTISTLDLDRYMGRWYEIARFDHRFERNLEQCETFYKLLPEGKISVENTGINTLSGKRKTSYGKAHAGKSPGQLRVSFFLFFYSDYNILALDENYQWALVGSSSPDYLWILSRTPQLPQQTLDHILNIARKRGYDTSKLIYVKQ
jgi:lipocalin